MTSPVDRADLKDRIDAALARFLAGQMPQLAAIGPGLETFAAAVGEAVLSGGKRLRPAFCYWGARGAGAPDTDALVAAAGCLELLQSCALVHDDVMDDSDTRRGAPSVHRRFAALHDGRGWRGHPDAFGRSAAILLGDLCLIWADRLLDSSGATPQALARARPVYDAMRSELMAGQYLDLLEQVSGTGTVEGALRVARLKSGAYTVERPLHLGAALADAPAEVWITYSGYGRPLGEAFQLRDDVLGVFGDPARTGKPAGDDLREGKRTVLVASALARATPAQAALIRRHLGDPKLDEQGVLLLRDVLCETGAVDEVERLVRTRTEQALAALQGAPLEPEACEVLQDLAVAATARRS